MPYEAKKQKCKKEDGSSGTHTIYKKGTSEKVGCTSDPSGYMAKLYSVDESANKDKQMKISRKELKEIIREHLKEGVFDLVSPPDPPSTARSLEDEDETLDTAGT